MAGLLQPWGSAPPRRPANIWDLKPTRPKAESDDSEGEEEAAAPRKSEDEAKRDTPKTEEKQTAYRVAAPLVIHSERPISTATEKQTATPTGVPDKTSSPPVVREQNSRSRIQEEPNSYQATPPRSAIPEFEKTHSNMPTPRQIIEIEEKRTTPKAATPPAVEDVPVRATTILCSPPVTRTIASPSSPARATTVRAGAKNRTQPIALDPDAGKDGQSDSDAPMHNRRGVKRVASTTSVPKAEPKRRGSVVLLTLPSLHFDSCTAKSDSSGDRWGAKGVAPVDRPRRPAKSGCEVIDISSDDEAPVTGIPAGGIWGIKPKKRKAAPKPELKPPGSSGAYIHPSRRITIEGNTNYEKSVVRRNKPATIRYDREDRFKRRSESPPPGMTLGRTAIIDLENCAFAIKEGMKEYMMRTYDRDVIRKMRKALHKAPFLPVTLKYRHRVTNIIQELLHEEKSSMFPGDILCDAKYLLNKWMSDDFDPDLLRGVEKNVRYRDTTGRDGPAKRRVTSSSLDPHFRWRRSPAVPGNNGLVVGQWWPLQICTMRDGAHGSIEGGIAGDREAAVSVVLSGGHKDPKLRYDDEDHLDVVYYCGTRGEKAMPDPRSRRPMPGIPSANTGLLLKALQLSRPVRLIRSAKAKTRYSPSEGLRYDGLYNVVKKEVLDAENAMFRFRLERCRNQPEVRWSGEGVKPTSEERDHWEDHKHLWKHVV